MNRTFNSFGLDIILNSELLFVWVRLFLRNRTSPELASLLVTNPNPHEPTREVYSFRWGMQSKYFKESSIWCISLSSGFLLLEPYLHRAGPVFPFIRISGSHNRFSDFLKSFALFIRIKHKYVAILNFDSSKTGTRSIGISYWMAHWRQKHLIFAVLCGWIVGGGVWGGGRLARRRG